MRPDRHALGLGPGARLDGDLGVGQVAEELLEQPHGAGVDRGALLEHDAVAARPHDVLAEDRAEQRLVVVLARRPRRHRDRLLGAAVLLADDHVLGDVDETTRQVARVGRAQRRVGEALAGAVGRDEELEHREALDEARLDRPLDDLALRVGHLTAPAGELADLLDVAAGAGGGHHVDRVERVEVGPRGGRDLHVGLAPDLLDLLAPLGVGQEAAVVLLLDLGDHVLVGGQDLGLALLGDHDVVL